MAAERLVFDRSDQQKSNQQLSSAPPGLFYVQVLFFSALRPSFIVYILYPLTKPAGHQSSYMSCPTTYDAHKNTRWSKMRWCVLMFCV
jgi:hypothetical protein